MKSLLRKIDFKVVVASFGFWLFITNSGLVVSDIGGWNNYSRISTIFHDLGVYGFRSELIPNILFFLSVLFIYITRNLANNTTINTAYKKHIRIISIFFSFIYVIGNIAEKSTYIFGGPFRVLLFLASIFKFFGLYFIFSNILIIFYAFILSRLKDDRIYNRSTVSSHSSYWFYWVIIMVSWVPYIVLNYPGIITTDGFFQLRQVTGLSPITDHHPVLHTLILWLMHKISVMINGNNSITVVMYVLFQSLTLSAIYAYTVDWLSKKGLHKNILIVVLGYFSLMPIHGFNATVLSKDFLSGGFFLLAIIWLFDYFEIKNDNDKKIFWRLAGIVFFVFAGLLRNNMYYAIFFTTSLLLIITIFAKSSFKIKDALMFIIILLLLLSKGILINQLNIPGSPPTESLSIPVQQIARSIYLNEEIPEDIQVDVEKFFTVDEVKELYDPYISDPIKFRIAERGGDFNTIIRLWRILGIQNPFIYLDSFIFSNFGYWYPQINFSSVLFPSDETVYTEHGIEIPFHGYGMYVSTIIVQAFQFIPILNLLTGIGFMFLLLIIAFDHFLLEFGANRILIVYIPLLLAFFTLLIAAPMTGAHRYAHFLFSTMPVFVLFPIIHRRRCQISQRYLEN